MKELDRFRKFLAEGKKSTSGGMLLSENAPGYDDRKFGNPLPTLESVQAAHEAKKDEEDEVRDGVRSAAEKLGMKPSHIKEVDSFDFTIYGPMYDFATGVEMGTDPQEINYEETLDMGSEEEMIALAKQYAADSPKEKFIVTHTDDPWNEVWSTDAESMDKKERRAGVNEEFTPDLEKDDLQRKAIQQMMAKEKRLGPSSQFTFEPSDPKKDLMIHTIVDEYQDKIFDYLWNYELYRNEYLKEDINYDEFDEKDEFEEQTIDPEDLTYPLESAMARVNIYDLGDIKSTKQFNDLVKAMEKTGEVPDEFFALKAEEQMGIIRQAVMYI